MDDEIQPAEPQVQNTYVAAQLRHVFTGGIEQQLITRAATEETEGETVTATEPEWQVLPPVTGAVKLRPETALAAGAAGAGNGTALASPVAENGSPRTRTKPAMHLPRPEWQARALASLSLIPNINLACRAAGIGRQTFVDWRHRDPAFDAAVRLAIREGVDLAHAAAWQRAFEGCLRPVYQGGILVGYEQVYSDKLAEFLLRSHAKDGTDAGAEMQESVNINVRASIVHADAATIADRVRRLSPLITQRATGNTDPLTHPVS